MPDTYRVTAMTYEMATVSLTTAVRHGMTSTVAGLRNVIEARRQGRGVPLAVIKAVESTYALFLAERDAHPTAPHP